ncbi:uncharacterized protein LY89DRAFT_598786 [Mollisia scopiformis]|uniref:CENP-V/GFA domain-containing protein n=1 Tax=Mollisia scopiformis TaxID=149040 RepID=A0A132B9N9_MOLSC|nr:uncharacterized protein LY89DRAFT_598786 [Mollisia scopiformis]KUJ09120.1 hypothetical protein LY89DRAFT_598786 [Mollisia scopiformis]
MPEGGCFCNKIRLSYTGELNAHALCHCLDCRKIGGSSYSNNLIVPEQNFKLHSGISFFFSIMLCKPKEISKTADSGKTIVSHFCPDCGTTLFRTGESFPGAVIIKAGVLDDPNFPSQNVPKAELFAPERIAWIPAIEGAAQLPGMPPA